MTVWENYDSLTCMVFNEKILVMTYEHTRKIDDKTVIHTQLKYM